MKKERQYRSNQGRSPQREAETMKVILYSFLLLAVGGAIALIVELIW